MEIRQKSMDQTTNYIICKICEGPFRDQTEYNDHTQQHLKGESNQYMDILTCEKCDSKFEDQRQMNIHLWQHLGVFSCEDCDERFFSTEDLDKHKKEHSDLESVQVGNSGTKEFICDICGLVFKYKRKLVFHRIQHENPDVYKCNICSKKLSNKYTLQEHLKSHENPDMYKCNVCDKRYSSGRALRLHLNFHKNPDDLKCKVCQKGFFRSYELEKHLKIHSDAGLHCRFCNKKFSINTRNLASHEERCSENDEIKPDTLLNSCKIERFKCQICQKGFLRPCDLEKHSNIHSDDGLHCKFCNKQFSLNTRFLKSHEEKCSKINGSKLDKFTCDMCQSKFVDKYKLENHLRLHANLNIYKCNVCDKRYSSRRGLRGHLNLHTNPDKTKCKICQKVIPRPFDINNHLKTHSKDRLHCKFCNKKFSLVSRHLKLHEEKCSEKPEMQNNKNMEDLPAIYEIETTDHQNTTGLSGLDDNQISYEQLTIVKNEQKILSQIPMKNDSCYQTSVTFGQNYISEQHFNPVVKNEHDEFFQELSLTDNGQQISVTNYIIEDEIDPKNEIPDMEISNEIDAQAYIDVIKSESYETKIYA